MATEENLAQLIHDILLTCLEKDRKAFQAACDARGITIYQAAAAAIAEAVRERLLDR